MCQVILTPQWQLHDSCNDDSSNEVPLIAKILISTISLCLQVFGMFAVVATATACLYFVDPSGIAKQAGTDAAGVLTLILNAAFLLSLAILIIKAGSMDAVYQAQQMLLKARSLMQRLWAKIACCGRRGRSTTKIASSSIIMTGRPSMDRMQSGASPVSRQASTDLLRMGPRSPSMTLPSPSSAELLQKSRSLTPALGASGLRTSLPTRQKRTGGPWPAWEVESAFWSAEDQVPTCCLAHLNVLHHGLFCTWAL